IHAPPNYPKTIQELGTTDTYSTQNGELEHCCCKHFYPWVHKGLFASGIARNHGLVVTRRPPHKIQKTLSRKSLSISFSQSEHLPPANPDQRYQMSNETRHPHDISKMLGDYYGDPACKV
ncbi:hypothetical protein BYT27DRAFT_7006806, partial [Phlegmacium glaucopus]